MDVLAAIEHSAFAEWVRTSQSLWAYPGVLFLHTVGLAIVAGISTMVNLRLLGFARTLPIAPIEKFFPIMWAGFWINAVSGAVLFAQDATTKATNPAFVLKMILIALAVVSMAIIRRVVSRHPDANTPVSGWGRVLAAASLVLWFGAMTAGRLMIYVG